VELEVGVVDEAGNKGAQAREELGKPSRMRLKEGRCGGGGLRACPRVFSQRTHVWINRLLLMVWTACSQQVRGWAKKMVGWAMTWRVRGADARGSAANDVAPVVVFHLSLKRHLVGGWNGGGCTSRRVGVCQMREGGYVPNVGRRKCAILGRGAKRDFPCCLSAWWCREQAVLQAGKGGCISRMIYHSAM
jgi:hypothetical protein